MDLLFASGGRLWKCRSCGTRIPDPSYLEFLLRAVDPNARRRRRKPVDRQSGAGYSTQKTPRSSPTPKPTARSSG